VAIGPALNRRARALIRLVAVALISWQAQAAAQRPSPSALEQARAHFEAGVALFDVRNYAEALREFNIGYALSRRPRFLLNIAQTHRKLEQLDEARATFHKFLDETPPDDPDRKQAEVLLAEVDAAIAARARPPAPPHETAAAPALIAPAPAPPPKPPARRRWVLGVAIGGALLVAGGAVALGVTLGSSPRYPSGLLVPVR
jgi:tetratricopeptide (TPR) repeat protein